MRSIAAPSSRQPNPAAPLLESPPADLHLVEPRRRERADVGQQRQALQIRSRKVADLLARTELLEDRIELYRQRVFSARELSTAAALFPELMPVLNGEWEWIALTLADNE